MIIEDVINYASSQPKYVNITADILDEKSDAICFRQMGDNVVLNRYIGGGFVGSFSFAIICKSKANSRKKVIEQLEDYKKLFDMNSNIVLTDNITLIDSEMLSDIELVEYSDSKDVVYGITIRMIYEEVR